MKHGSTTISRKMPKLSKSGHFPGKLCPVSSARHAKKIMATAFWNCSGVVLIVYLARADTITGDCYAKLLEDVNR